MKTLFHFSFEQTFPRHHSRRGAALIMSIGLMAVLFSLLIAAQASLLTSAQIIKLRHVRINDSQTASTILSYAIASGSARGEVQTFSAQEPGASYTVTKLAGGADVYGSVEGISHRAGDASVQITWLEEDGSTRGTDGYLINTEGRRGGAIPIP